MASLSRKAKVLAVSAMGGIFLPTLKPSSQPGCWQHASPRFQRNRDAESTAALTDSLAICGQIPFKPNASQDSDPLPLSCPSALSSCIQASQKSPLRAPRLSSRRTQNLNELGNKSGTNMIRSSDRVSLQDTRKTGHLKHPAPSFVSKLGIVPALTPSPFSSICQTTL